MNDYVIEVKNIDKIYRLKDKKRSFFSKNKKKKFYALRNISINIERGDIVGILGTNGSGKSTLSSILAGLSLPSNGEVIFRGEQALIDVRTGLNDQLTGLENIELKCVLLGIEKERIPEITENVKEFAELGEFLYQPVKTYSSGMKSRLGFSIAISLNPDILIVDEALSVGDKAFAAKCLDYMNEIKQTGKTVIFISHSIGQMRKFCNSAIWIEGGELREVGDIDTVCDNYEKHVAMIKKMDSVEKARYKDEVFKGRVEE